MLPIHSNIKAKLKYFHDIHKIPHIIFHGSSGTGKRTIVNEFIHNIYDNDKTKIKSFVMYVNCSHGKGIKFIREELKFFAKTHINSNGGDIFKSIILLNADKLTIDAQSALRRCIELFSHTTRFFIIVEDKYKLLKPILSRFCEIYVPEPDHNGAIINLYRYNVNETFKLKDVKMKRLETLKKELNKVLGANVVGANVVGANVVGANVVDDCKIHETLLMLSGQLYEKGYNALDFINILEETDSFFKITEEKKYEALIAFNKVRKEFRNEKLLIMFILNFIYLSLNESLENISFM